MLEHCCGCVCCVGIHKSPYTPPSTITSLLLPYRTSWAKDKHWGGVYFVCVCVCVHCSCERSMLNPKESVLDARVAKSKEDKRVVTATAGGGAEELEKPPASSKSHVWEHFGFPVKYDDGRRVVDTTTITVCRHSATRKPYDHGKKNIEHTFKASSPWCVSDWSQLSQETTSHRGI
ncbi:unnamed protein product [Oncorhynchus mykiss]|uniref:Uncharacterized protein n=1 Tax=Oncorhynchus mykiss TaxID=8022 RepID=A0A060WVB8_ONCMY|nr:unnamed protein product [Oncorhynchus mykiss]